MEKIVGLEFSTLRHDFEIQDSWLGFHPHSAHDWGEPRTCGARAARTLIRPAQLL